MQIKYPCSENWEAMKLGIHSRYCDNCQKDVIDFTNRSREEILKHILINYDKQVCGRIYSSQLDFTHTDILIAIQGLSPKQKNSNLPFYLLTVGTLILTSCNIKSTNDNIVTNQHDTTTSESKSNTIKNSPQSKNLSLIVDEMPISGEILVESDTLISQSEPYRTVEVMPEFVGGIDSLMSYFNANLNYPEWEKKNKIQGAVYVSFIVNKEGKIKDSRILKSVTGSKNFDKEVLKVIDRMPDWKPGEHHSKKVDVQYNLPIRFAL